MVSRTGANFEDKFRDWHKEIDCITFKFPDYKSTGILRKAICDRVTIYDGGTYWFECKTTKSNTSFSFSQIKLHQWDYLLKISKYKNNHGVFVLQDGRYNVYMIHALDLLMLKGNDKKSIRFESLYKWKVLKRDFPNLFINEFIRK
jgi:recombination protein U